MISRSTPARFRIAALAIGAGLAVALVACSPVGGETEETGGPVPTSEPTGGSNPSATAPTPPNEADGELPIWVGVVGDSNTTGLANTLTDAIQQGTSWITLVPQSEIKYAGGWAKNGATSEDMLLHVTALPDAEALVIMAGTNDVAQNVSYADYDENIREISAKVGAPQTVLSAIPPFDARADDATAMNTHIAALAMSEGWIFIDPWQSMRDENGKWLDIYHKEGLHTTPEGYQVMALALRDELVAALAPDAVLPSS